SDTSSTHNTFYSPSIFLHCSFTFLLLPRQPPRSTPFPYTTLFRSPKITDGNRATYWSTEQYRDFQKSKPGVGVVLDAQGAVQLSRIIVTTDTPGFTAEVESTNILGSTPQPVSDSHVVAGSTTFDIKPGAPRRYYVIWITKLPPGLDHAHV